MSIFSNLLGKVLRGGLSWYSRRSLPAIAGELKVPGVDAGVEVIRDRWGVPHIYANTLHDLFFAQGFIHAQDRLFQMEMNRRTAQGQLSELFGEIALDTDRATRTFGFNRLGKVDWQQADAEIKSIFLAYTDGVNAYLRQPGLKLPIEFTLIGHHPKPWTPEDLTAFARVMVWQLSHAWYGGIVRAQMAAAVGEEHAAELEIHYPSQNPLILPQGIEFNRLDANGVLQALNGPFLKASMGSNSWAVSGARSDTGKAYLCNDMHLALSAPGLWYENHLVSEDYQVSGVSLPGVPLVLVGHNTHVAWGMTLAFTDCEDLFVEQFDPEYPSRYRCESDWIEAELIPEAISVKGKHDPHIEEVFVTRHGPVISDVVGYSQERVAVNSMALRPNAALRGWFQLNKACDWDEFVSAMRLIEAPQLSVSYADVDGNIGFWVTGKVPIRAKGDGSVPAPGWTGEYEWVGEVPFEAMPHALNPQEGLVLHTNNRIVPEDYPYFLGNVWMNGYRARRIREMFAGKEKLGIEIFSKVHIDYTCLPGIELVSRLCSFNSPDSDVKMGLELLLGWNGELSAESVGGCVYEVLRYYLVRNLVKPGLDEKLTDLWMGKGFHPLLKTASEFYGHDTVTLLRLLDHPESWWMQQAGGLNNLVTQSMKQTVDWLKEHLGYETSNWQWGKLHQVIFPHPLGLQKPLDLVFNLGYLPIGGDTDTPCQTAYKAEEPYQCNAWAPSFRQIVDMGDLDRSLVIAPPGQSGHLASQHYDDMIQPWLQGQYHPMLWSRHKVESEAEGRLHLSS
jgi:penicillin amidase